MHKQTEQREERLLHASPTRPLAERGRARRRGRRQPSLFESSGATQVVEGGQSMNPSAAELLAAIDRTDAPSVFVLPNNSNVVLAAEQAAELSTKDVHVIRTDSIPAGLAALVAFDSSKDADANAEAMEEALGSIATGAVTIASKDAQLNGVAISKGNFLGLAGGEPVAQGADFDEVAHAVFERLLAEPRDFVTLLTGLDSPDVTGLVAALEREHPDLELEVHKGGQPHYPCSYRPNRLRLRGGGPGHSDRDHRGQQGLPRGARAPSRLAQRPPRRCVGVGWGRRRADVPQVQPRRRGSWTTDFPDSTASRRRVLSSRPVLT
jgi:dihydroxyacetone kinase-like predicted kinase